LNGQLALDGYSCKGNLVRQFKTNPFHTSKKSVIREKKPSGNLTEKVEVKNHLSFHGNIIK
jgi:hypothetical protein